jgi:hypothetical protein
MDGQYSRVICTVIAGWVTGDSLDACLPPHAVIVADTRRNTIKMKSRFMGFD